MTDFEHLLSPIRIEDEPEVPPNPEFLAWLKAKNPEFGAFNDALTKLAVRGGYRNELFPGKAETVAEALSVDDDGCRAARIRGLFIGASAILEDAEELWLASWATSDKGTSVVIGSHQDERDLWAVSPSIRDFVLLQYREDSYFEKDLELPEDIKTLEISDGAAKLDPLWDPLVLTERVHWLVALLFPEGDWYGLGDGLVTAPPFARFAEEEPLLANAPHLLAYWLAHHAVFGNTESFARIAPLGLASPYPPAREIAAMPGWCKADGLRTAALRKREDLFEPAAIAATKAVRERREQLRNTIKSALAKKERSAAAMLLGALLDGAKLEAIDSEVIKDLRPNPPLADTADKEIQTLLLAKRGNAPGLGLLFEQIPEEIDASWDGIGKALIELAELEPHEDLARVAVMYADAKPVDDRLGRLAQVAVALRRGNMDYVRAEATRFLAMLSKHTTDTAALALEVCIARKDEAVTAALEEAAKKKKPHAGTMKALETLRRSER
jgi:hypothetical protein